MGAFKGTLSYKLFYVQGELPPKWKERFIEQIEKNAFRELTPEDEDGESVGWVRMDRPLSTDFSWHNIKYNQYINLALRQDRYVIPSALMEAHLQEAIDEYKRKNDTDELSKYEEEDLKELVERDLREQQLPRMRLIDVSWNIKTGKLRFWSQANKRAEMLRQHFKETFQMDVIPANPYTSGVELEMGSEEVDWLQQVEPTHFVSRRDQMTD